MAKGHADGGICSYGSAFAEEHKVSQFDVQTEEQEATEPEEPWRSAAIRLAQVLDGSRLQLALHA